MGRCRKCKGTKVQLNDPPFDNVLWRCLECGGSGTDEKPQCPKHKVSHEYSGSCGWRCPKCDFARSISWWDDVYYPEA